MRPDIPTQRHSSNRIANDGGSIVHIGSMRGKRAIKATVSSVYSMAKAGLHALTQHMAMKLAENNIRVNAVSPAVGKTPIFNAAGARADHLKFSAIRPLFLRGDFFYAVPMFNYFGILDSEKIEYSVTSAASKGFT